MHVERLHTGAKRPQARPSSRRESTRTERSAGGFLTEATAAVAMSISGIGLAIAIAALIFSGPLEVGLPRATGNFVMATAVVTGLVGWRSRLVPAVAVIQDGPAVVLVSAAAAMATSSEGDGVLDVFVFIACVTAISGILMMGVGHFGLGGAVRFLPTTVIIGFVAGTGWLLVKGGFDVMLAASLERDDLTGLLDPSVMKFWAPGVLLGVAMQAVGAARRIPPVAMSLMVIGAVVGFFVVVAVVSSIATVEDANWLIGPFPSAQGLQPLVPSELQSVDWGNIVGSPGAAVAVIAVSLVAVLLNVSGLEVVTRSRVDMGNELRITGLTNLLIAPLGVTPGCHALGDTALAGQMGARTRFVPLATAGACFVTAWVGGSWVGYTPRFVAGGLLVAVGIGLLMSWGRSIASCPSVLERLLSTLILVLIASVGILEGLVVGLVIACLIFVLRYSMIDPVRRESTGHETPSRVVRTAAEQESLNHVADQLVVYQLNGYLFFGSFTTMSERIRARLDSTEVPPSFLVLDFRHVTGIDSSAFDLLDQLADDIAGAGVELLISGMTHQRTSQRAERHRTHFVRLDDALEYAEEQLLDRGEEGCRTTDDSFAGLSAALRGFLTARSVRAGEVIIKQGEPGSSMYLVSSGSLIVIGVEADGSRHRLRRVGAGAVLGEVSVLTGRARSAEIVADTDSELFELERSDYELLRRDHPEVALELQDALLLELVGRASTLSKHLSLALR